MSALNVLDYALLASLLVILPARSVWRTWISPLAESTVTSRYRRTLLVVLGLLSLLAANWIFAGRSAASLGLALPSSVYEYGLLGIAAAILAVAATGMLHLHQKPAKPGSMEAEGLEQLPKTMPEVRLAILAAFGLGFGWEVLYRGYLLFALVPVTGTAAAVTLAAMSYAIGHGDKSVLRFAGSAVAAFVFTIAFAATGSLWWLIVVHVGLPLLAAVHGWKRIAAAGNA